MFNARYLINVRNLNNISIERNYSPRTGDCKVQSAVNELAFELEIS